MLRVGLTGELGSGKSTVARLLAAQGAVIFSSDEIGRAMMQPGEPVYKAIVDHFGSPVVLADGQLNRPELARVAFDATAPRVEELNAIVHPAVLVEQERLLLELGRTDPRAIAVIESALIFRVSLEPWRQRFDRVVLVTAPDELKVQRYVRRAAGSRSLRPEEQAALAQEAKDRLAVQRTPPHAIADCLVIENSGGPEALAARTAEVFQQLRQMLMILSNEG